MVGGATLSFVVVGAVVLERAAELVLSRRNARWALERGAIETGQEHYGSMVAFHAFVLVACVVEPVLYPRDVPAPLVAGCLAALACAQALRWWAIHTLGPRWNTRIIVLPNADPVTTGPYHWLRHPNYVAVIVEMVALPLVGGAWMTAVCASLLNALLLRTRVRVEERALGLRWTTAFATTPRFVPGGPPAGT